MLNHETCTPTELARKLGVSRARVTQVLRLMRLAPDVLHQLSELGDPLPTPIVTERMLRPIVDLLPNDQRDWMANLIP